MEAPCLSVQGILHGGDRRYHHPAFHTLFARGLLMKVPTAALLLVVSSVGWAVAQNPPDPSKLPEIHVPRTKAAIRIDGKLDEADWAGAPRILLRKLDGTAASQRTEARILHDGAHVYIAFQAEDPDVWTAHQGRDSHMWTEDV